MDLGCLVITRDLISLYELGSIPKGSTIYKLFIPTKEIVPMLSSVFVFIFFIFIQPDTETAETVAVKKNIPVVQIPEDEIIIQNIPAEYIVQ